MSHETSASDGVFNAVAPGSASVSPACPAPGSAGVPARVRRLRA